MPGWGRNAADGNIYAIEGGLYWRDTATDKVYELESGWWRNPADGKLYSIYESATFEGPFMYRFNTSQSFTWPFPGNMRVKLTMRGGQGGQGGEGEASSTFRMYRNIRAWSRSPVGQRVYGGSGGRTRAANVARTAPLSVDGHARSRTFAESVGGSSYVAIAEYDVAAVLGNNGTDGATTHFVERSNTYNVPGTVGSPGGAGTLPKQPSIPDIVTRTLEGVPTSTQTTITIGGGGSGGNGNGGDNGADGADGYIELQAVDSNGNSITK